MPLIKLRKPAIRIGRKGVRLTNVGATIGGKGARVNLGRRGASVTVGRPGASFNTRRGCLFSPFTLLASLFKRRGER